MRALWRGIVAALLLTACARAEATSTPRAIEPGVDACGYCHMAVDDERRAAQWVGQGGEVRMFDEPGCLAAWLDAHPQARGTAWVADEAGGGWIAAVDAHFVAGATRTGMGFDVVAFADEVDARAHADALAGQVIGWDQVLNQGGGHAHAR